MPAFLSAVEGNSVLISNIDNTRSLVVNLNLLFSVTAALVGSVIAQLEDIPHGLRRFFVNQPFVPIFGILNTSVSYAWLRLVYPLPIPNP